MQFHLPQLRRRVWVISTVAVVAGCATLVGLCSGDHDHESEPAPARCNELVEPPVPELEGPCCHNVAEINVANFAPQLTERYLQKYSVPDEMGDAILAVLKRNPPLGAAIINRLLGNPPRRPSGSLDAFLSIFQKNRLALSEEAKAELMEDIAVPSGIRALAEVDVNTRALVQSYRFAHLTSKGGDERWDGFILASHIVRDEPVGMLVLQELVERIAPEDYDLGALTIGLLNDVPAHNWRRIPIHTREMLSTYYADHSAEQPKMPDKLLADRAIHLMRVDSMSGETFLRRLFLRRSLTRMSKQTIASLVNDGLSEDVRQQLSSETNAAMEHWLSSQPLCPSAAVLSRRASRNAGAECSLEEQQRCAFMRGLRADLPPLESSGPDLPF